MRQLRKHVRTEIARTAGEVLRNGRADQSVATSKTFRQLARIAGAAPSGEGSYVRRNLRHTELTPWASRLAKMKTAQRTQLPGVSATRAPQLLAGAIVADAAMDLFELEELELCPWALREGVILQRLDGMAGRRTPRTARTAPPAATAPAEREQTTSAGRPGATTAPARPIGCKRSHQRGRPGVTTAELRHDQPNVTCRVGVLGVALGLAGASRARLVLRR